MVGRGFSFQCHYLHHHHHHHHHPLKTFKLGMLLILLFLLLLSLRAKAWFDLLQEDDLWRHHHPLQHSNKDFTFRDKIVVSSHPKMKMKVEVSSATASASEAHAAMSSPSTLSSSTKQPGSRPPECKSACPGCPSECIARPIYVVGTHDTYQHALWTCMCVF